METPVIETRALTRRFGKKIALRDVTLTIPAGGIHAIVGSNGAGKSTLFRLLLGVQTPTSGSCRLLGASSENLPPHIRGQVSYVNEEHSLPTWMKVADVIAMQRSYYPDWDTALFSRGTGCFDLDPNQRVRGLSRGERAGLNLSMALAQRPRLLILDEPTMGLDVVAKKAFLDILLFSRDDTDGTIVYCSHHMDEIERLADTLTVMEQGRIRHCSSPHEFCSRIDQWIANGAFPDFDAPGLLSHRVIEGQSLFLVMDRGEAFGEDLTRAGATSVSRRGTDLESAVNAFLSANHAANRSSEEVSP